MKVCHSLPHILVPQRVLVQRRLQPPDGLAEPLLRLLAGKRQDPVLGERLLVAVRLLLDLLSQLLLQLAPDIERPRVGCVDAAHQRLHLVGKTPHSPDQL